MDRSATDLASAHRVARTLAVVLAGYVVVGGFVSLLGWIADVPLLTDWDLDGISIQPNAAVAAMAMGAALLLLAYGRARAAAIGAAFVAGVGGSVLFQYVTGVDLGIDTLLMFDHTWGRVGVLSPGRMGPPGATSWTLLGIATLCATRPVGSAVRRCAVWLGVATTAISSLSVVGYLYGAEGLFTIPTLTVIAFQTATFVLAASLALLATVREHGPVRRLLEPGPAAVLVRRLLPALIVAPVVIGFLVRAGFAAGLYDQPFGAAMRTLVEIALSVGLLWWTSVALARQARERERADSALRSAETTIHGLNARLRTDLEAMNRLQFASVRLIEGSDPAKLLDEILEAAIALSAADMGNVQVIADGALRIAAQRGFARPFLDYFATVHEGEAACGAAMRRVQRVTVEDVTTSPIFRGSPALDVLLAAGVRAVQSTPLISRSGRLVGMLSTHHRRPHQHEERSLRMLDLLARQAADSIERSRAEDTLRERQGALAEAERLARLGSWHWHVGTDVAVVSDGLRAIFGWPRERPFPAFRDQDGVLYPHASWVAIDAAARAALADGSSYVLDVEALRGDGRIWVTVRGEALRDAAGQVVGLRGTVQEITARKRAALAILDSEQRFRSLVSVIADVPWTTDPAGGFVEPQAAWTAYTGQTWEQHRGFGWAEALHPDDRARVLADWRACCEQRTTYRSHGRVWHAASGQWRYFTVRATPLLADDGSLRGWVGACTDVDEQQRATAEREEAIARERIARAQAERTAQLKDEFLATLSHELRTPLNAILGWTQILEKDLGDREKAARAVDVLKRNGRLQAQLVADILDMSRIVSGKMRLDVQAVDLHRVIRDAVESIRPAAEAKQIAIEQPIAVATAVVHGDPTRLQQVVWNLLSNAVKFTPKGGQVRIGLAMRSDEATISVQDTGQGIAAEFLPHVFDRFRQADASTARPHSGLGLGLAIVKQLVELHGGSVRVASDGEGKGACFVIELPLVARGDAAAERPAVLPANSPEPRRSAPADVGGLRVLLVEDDPDALAMTQRLLQDAAAVVTAVGSAADALRALRAAGFDVIVSDIGMPGTDGYDLLAEVRRLGIATPALALTAFVRPEDRDKALACGYQAHLAKPVRRGELLSAIAALAGRSTGRQPSPR